MWLCWVFLLHPGSLVAAVGPLSLGLRGLLTAGPPVVRGSSAAAPCLAACGISPDQGSDQSALRCRLRS